MTPEERKIVLDSFNSPGVVNAEIIAEILIDMQFRMHQYQKDAVELLSIVVSKFEVLHDLADQRESLVDAFQAYISSNWKDLTELSKFFEANEAEEVQALINRIIAKFRKFDIYLEIHDFFKAES